MPSTTHLMGDGYEPGSLSPTRLNDPRRFESYKAVQVAEGDADADRAFLDRMADATNSRVGDGVPPPVQTFQRPIGFASRFQVRDLGWGRVGLLSDLHLRPDSAAAARQHPTRTVSINGAWDGTWVGAVRLLRPGVHSRVEFSASRPPTRARYSRSDGARPIDPMEFVRLAQARGITDPAEAALFYRSLQRGIS